MTADDITKLIEADLEARKDIRTCLSFDRCRVTPVLQDYYSSSDDVQPEKLWLVLEEDPSKHVGYSIFYDESMSMFGLGHMSENGKRISFSLYESFCDAVEAM